ncbi:DUF2388 domain-containing protein [Pseudomonas sp. BN515]|uniref:DUF2388 domain-containing protein n=1 Tax=Pseudomonas sp. BN515 TaxID=2567892 RepID=UPI0024562066|nr:DUF2388 domain-containing protein [Pseudomonas sp. BN515]MDH4870702.1 DUF2388 domain-containing protein [Pseudomonas sp. BN515]
MTSIRLLSAAALLALATSASATSFVVTTDAVVNAVKATSDATSDVTSSSFDDDKIVLAAREDAASFVASNGDIRGARLEAAFKHIRSAQPQLAASDLQLAQAILAL